MAVTSIAGARATLEGARGRIGASDTLLIRTLGVGAFGLAWAITTVATYVPPVLENFTDSKTVIGVVLGAEGAFAAILPLLVGPLSDATHTRFGRRRTYMVVALAPMALALGLIAFMPSLVLAAAVLFVFFAAYYFYEPPYRGIYPDRLPEELFGRSQGTQHIFRALAIGGALVLGAIFLGAWQPLPFILAAIVAVGACGALVALLRPDRETAAVHARFRESLGGIWRIVRRERHVRRVLIANTAWEATFAGMRTFVVLYIVQGLGQPVFVSSAVLATVAAGYVVAASVAGSLGDRLGIARVILFASVVYGVGLAGAGLASTWHSWFYLLIFPVAIAGGTVMTLAWGLLYKVMPSEHRGSAAGLGGTTKGLGLLIGPLAVGAVIDIARPYLEATNGYAAMWPAVALPVLAAIPLVWKLVQVEPTNRDSRPAV